MTTQEELINRRVMSRVIELRESMHLEKQDVAAMLQMTPQGYSPYESGTRPFTIAQVFTLARALGKPVEFLLGLDGELTEDERELLWLYRLLEHKSLALQFLRTMATPPAVR